MEMFDVLPTSKYAKLKSHKIDSKLPNNINCEYYSVDKLHNLLNSDNFNLNIFHCSANGLETKFDNLHEFLSKTPSSFDVVNITETSEKSDDGLKQILILKVMYLSLLLQTQ